MAQALKLAQISYNLGEVPVGALVVVDNKIVGQGYNLRELKCSSLEHAEINALKNAHLALSRWRLCDATVYATLEPCIMCMGALLHARVKRLVYGAADPKFGAVESLYTLGQDVRLNHQIEIVSGLYALESAHLLKNFFSKVRRERRQKPSPIVQKRLHD